MKSIRKFHPPLHSVSRWVVALTALCLPLWLGTSPLRVAAAPSATPLPVASATPQPTQRYRAGSPLILPTAAPALPPGLYPKPSPGLRAQDLPARGQLEREVNPHPRALAAIASGRRLYLLECAVCHGPHGRGDGRRGQRCHPAPRDLVRGHFAFGGADSQIYASIQLGFPSTCMRPWYGRLTKPQVWDLVNYVQSLRSRTAAHH
jgi:mono/diheme cytochrome c family protein